MNKILIKNFFSLTSVQIANYVLPLITLPYLSRIIGVEKFGVIAFAQAIAFYFLILTVFGFDLYTPKEVSIARDNPFKLRKIFWSVFYARAFLCLISLFVYLIFISSTGKLRQEFLLFVFSFGFIFGDILFSLWFFQGIERMTYIAAFNFISKFLYTISIFAFVKEQSDYILVPLFFSTSQILIGIIVILIVIFVFDLKPLKISLKAIIDLFRETSYLFFSNISMSIYLKMPIIFLGFFAGNLYTGYYSAAEKIIFALHGIHRNLMQTLYPHSSKLVAREDKTEAFNFIKKSLLIALSLGGLLTFSCLIFARPVITTIYGKEFLGSINIFQILSILFIIEAINGILGLQIMLPFGMIKQYTTALTLAGLINILLCLLLIPSYKHIGASLSLLFTDIWIAISMFFMIKRSGFKLLTKLKFK